MIACYEGPRGGTSSPQPETAHIHTPTCLVIDKVLDFAGYFVVWHHIDQLSNNYGKDCNDILCRDSSSTGDESDSMH